MIRLAALVVCAVVALPIGDSRAEPLKAAVFDLELRDRSLEGEINGTSESELQRLAMLSDRLRHALDASERYEVVDDAAVRDKAHSSNLQACGGCDRTMAAEMGADVSVTGLVNKISNLILSISISVRDVGSGRFIESYNVDIRSNSDESWSRGLDWLLEHRLLVGEAQQ